VLEDGSYLFFYLDTKKPRPELGLGLEGN